MLTRFSILLISIVFLVIVPVIAADSVGQPQLPHAFFGTIEAGGSPVNAGLAVEAVGIGVRSGIEENPVTTSTGSYGAAGATGEKLLVQGTVDTGTLIDFYVGGLHAEVYDVAAGGPWSENFTYEPGGYTELNLRIASQPAVGQTREPTPVQTYSVSSEVTASSTVASFGGSSLPQLPESQGQQPASEGTLQAPAENGQSGATGQGGDPSAGSPGSGSQSTGNGTENPLGSGNMTLLIGAGIVLLIVIAGGAYYYTNQKKSESLKTEEPEQKKE
ncbi:MAG: hypothetical protein MUE45_00440 [Methanoregulaceae archaeon]|nr:hypothetical protein [Methanoregulaceae archaeon]